jgi:hypothetical protein
LPNSAQIFYKETFEYLKKIKRLKENFIILSDKVPESLFNTSTIFDMSEWDSFSFGSDVGGGIFDDMYDDDNNNHHGYGGAVSDLGLNNIDQGF